MVSIWYISLLFFFLDISCVYTVYSFLQPYAPLVQPSPRLSIREDFNLSDSLVPPSFEKTALTIPVSQDYFPLSIRYLVDVLHTGTLREIGGSYKRAMYDKAVCRPA